MLTVQHEMRNLISIINRPLIKWHVVGLRHDQRVFLVCVQQTTLQ